jgi:peptide chain release factor 1
MSERELLFSLTKKDFEIQWFSGSGGGGQHRNKHQNCCRLRHPASGARAIGQRSRSRKDNLASAARVLLASPEFTAWHARVCAELMGRETVEAAVEREMAPENLRVETRESGRWEGIR